MPRSTPSPDGKEPRFAARVLRSLVATPSVNPGVYEAAMGDRVAAWFGGTSFELTCVDSMPKRPSVAAVLAGSGDGPRLVLNGHMDTVPIDDLERWDCDPFGGEVRDGYLYGRGACDMKAGLAVQIAVAHELAQAAERLEGTLILHFAAGEETGEPGTRSLLEAGFAGDFGITTEPTGLEVSTATRGLCFYRIRIKGRSVHASRAESGHNPIDHLGEVLEVVAGYRERIQRRVHPLLGSGSCTPTLLRSGVARNAVPDSCEISLDRRLLPGESIEGELAELSSGLDGLRRRRPGLEVAVTADPNGFEPAEIDPGSSLARVVVREVEAVTGRGRDPIGTPFASDVRNLVNDAGMEAVTFGPGDVTECHCANERVSLSQVDDAAAIIGRVAKRLLLDGDLEVGSRVAEATEPRDR